MSGARDALDWGMTVCPVCEHAQAAGAECEACGMRLAPGPAGEPAVAPLDGLETTGHAPVDAPEVAIPDLERTAHGRVDVDVPPGPEIEQTRAAPVDVAGEAVADLEPTRQAGLPDDGPTALPFAPTCRYCRTEAAPGERVCSRCGMRLPVVELALEPIDEGEETGPAPCPSCGVPASGQRCPTCGGRLTPAS